MDSKEKWPKEWTDEGGGEKSMERTTIRDDGSSKYEQLRTNSGDKEDHQHTWVDRDSNGDLSGGGATPGKAKKDESAS